jgi:ATP synthase protein I
MVGGREEKSFEERLASARDQAGMDKPPSPSKPPDNSEGNAIRLAMRLGVEMVAALVIAVVIGWGLDRLLHTRPWFMIAFVPIGAAAGIRNLIRAVGPGDKT